MSSPAVLAALKLLRRKKLGPIKPMKNQTLTSKTAWDRTDAGDAILWAELEAAFFEWCSDADDWHSLNGARSASGSAASASGSAASASGSGGPDGKPSPELPALTPSPLWYCQDIDGDTKWKAMDRNDSGPYHHHMSPPSEPTCEKMMRHIVACASTAHMYDVYHAPWFKEYRKDFLLAFHGVQRSVWLGLSDETGQKPVHFWRPPSVHRYAVTGGGSVELATAGWMMPDFTHLPETTVGDIAELLFGYVFFHTHHNTYAYAYRRYDVT